MTYTNVDKYYIFYGCCAGYLLIGGIVLRMYDVEEKHILMHDNVNYKRANIKSTCIFLSSCVMYGTINLYKKDETSHIATIIGSSIVLTLNGKLLEYCEYNILRVVSTLLSLIILCCMEYLKSYNKYIIDCGTAVIIGCKLIIFDSVHQMLHITHKKNVIDRYIGLEIVAMSCAFVLVHFIPENFLFQFCIACCLLQLLYERYTLKYYRKDESFLECINNLNEF